MNLSLPFNRIKILALVPVFYLTTAFQSPHSQIYDIYFGNNTNPIGTLTVKQAKSAEGRTNSMSSRIQSKLMARMEVDITSVFRNNVLHESRAVRKGELLTSVRQSGKKYVVVQKGGTRTLDLGGIIFSVGDLYFTEPEGVHSVFSETLARELVIRHLGNHLYELQLPEGKRNVYHYSKGKCTEVEVNHSLGKARFVLR